MITALLLAYLGISAAVTLVVATFLGRTRERVLVSLPVRIDEPRIVASDTTHLDRAA